MKPHFYQDGYKLGILGGGQLGRMLIQSGIDLNISFSVLDPDAKAPCHSLCEFIQGRLTDYQTVMDFGESCNLITIEIENVNTLALRDLAAQGKQVYPQPHLIELIQDKRAQKQFFHDHEIPTAEFVLTESRDDLNSHVSFLPAVHKLGREGYDGRGVQIIRNKSEIEKGFDAPGLLERLIDFDCEISVIVAKSKSGEVVSYPPVEMAFHPEKNLVEYLFAPASISDDIQQEADRIARKVIQMMDLVGVLAVEMFVTKNGDVLVNEVAPRPHNSGHHTIEANETSQYEQHLRAILDQPLGNTALRSPCAMVNLLGEDGFTGPAKYQGLDKVLAMEGTHIHLYGKTITKPFRKMGHVTIVDQNMESLKKKATFVKETLKVIS
ncbi:MAG: 5-(carboxyamino)imidazole ribonucleotide synthase [Cyclobacteriaceae bacterium]|nr:5-(carboxyamino)imidazole ribonucleotide synthase [Cyclobacteriaceae bacterium]